AYDNQRIRQVYAQTGDQAGTGMAVFFALQLYLDFINLFLAFLRIFGKNN
ncbi:BAX inhibitor (BI)-1/YccA family protein, partial [Enterococcus faecalis]|nr:BAX inhibitor (BI)-1/YccA family protein [Enterococcus faecalis]